MSQQQYQAHVQDEQRLQEEYEEWLTRQPFIRNKDDWFKAAEDATFFDTFMVKCYGRK